MKALKRLGAGLVTLLALTAALTSAALAAEPGDGGISVQLNGKPVVMTDAAPESVDGRTFVPLRAVMEAMNAQLDYDSQTGTVVIHRNGADLSMLLGQNTATVTEGGQTRAIAMDAAPYAKEGRTYVPVRFVAEAFACNVGWDASTQTVVIVDVDALFGDATFDRMDNFAAYCGKQEQSMALNGTLSLEAADKSGELTSGVIRLKGSLEGVSGAEGAQLAWRLDVSGLSALLGASLPELEGELRMDLESNMVYFTLPAMLTGTPADAWYALDLGAYQAQLLGGLDMAQLTQLQDAGIREALTAVLQSIPVNDSTSSYETLAMMVDLYKAMLSDQAFTQRGNTYVAQTTLADTADMTVTLTQQGDSIVAADILMSCDIDVDGDKVTLTMTEHAAPEQVAIALHLVMDEAGGIDIKLDLEVTGAPTSKTPVTTLPAGVDAVPLA